VPLVAAKLSQTSIASILWFDLLLAAAGLLLAGVISLRQPSRKAADKKTRLRQSEAVSVEQNSSPSAEKLRAD